MPETDPAAEEDAVALVLAAADDAAEALRAVAAAAEALALEASAAAAEADTAALLAFILLISA